MPSDICRHRRFAAALLPPAELLRRQLARNAFWSPRLLPNRPLTAHSTPPHPTPPLSTTALALHRHGGRPPPLWQQQRFSGTARRIPTPGRCFQRGRQKSQRKCALASLGPFYFPPFPKKGQVAFRGNTLGRPATRSPASPDRSPSGGTISGPPGGPVLPHVPRRGDTHTVCCCAPTALRAHCAAATTQPASENLPVGVARAARGKGAR